MLGYMLGQIIESWQTQYPWTYPINDQFPGPDCVNAMNIFGHRQNPNTIFLTWVRTYIMEVTKGKFLKLISNGQILHPWKKVYHH